MKRVSPAIMENNHRNINYVTVKDLFYNLYRRTNEVFKQLVPIPFYISLLIYKIHDNSSCRQSWKTVLFMG